VKNNDNPHIRLQHTLDQRRLEHRYRSLNEIDSVESSRIVTVDGKKYLNFSSNDYLNLAHHPEVIDRSRKYLEKYGSSSSSSRLITGSMKFHNNVECKLASIYNKDGALLFATGFQANSTILPAITEKKDVIIADQLCHNSILTGCLTSKAGFYRFRHNDLDHLETFLKRKSRNNSENIWVVTESLFSMDGDRAPLNEIIKLSAKYGAKIYVDDAHAFGVCGRNGFGFGADHSEIDVLIGTFGKAAGSFGAFVASDQTIIDALINYCSGFIYSTAPPPAVVGSIDAALDIIPDLKSERVHLAELAKFLHQELVQLNLETSDEPSHITPVIFGDEKFVLSKGEELKKSGMIVSAIRPPTVGKDQSRFRISLTVAHQKDDCKKLLDHLKA